MLQSDQLSDEEKRVVRAAVLTARKDSPNMTLIREADMLLKEVAKTRKIIEPSTQSDPLPPKTISTLETMKYDQSTRENKLAEDQAWKVAYKNADSKMYLYFALSVFVVIYGYKLLMPSPLHTFEEAKEICQEQGKFLPQYWYSTNDVQMSPAALTNGYWKADGQILFDRGTLSRAKDGEKYYVICVDKEKNNKIESLNSY